MADEAADGADDGIVLIADPEDEEEDTNDVISIIVLQALGVIDVTKKNQLANIQGVDLILDRVNAQYIVDFLRLHGGAVNVLRLGARQYTPQALAIFRAFFSSTSLHKIWLSGDLGNLNGGRLLSGLHGNNSVTTLELVNIGLDGRVGGEHLAALLLNNPQLQELVCVGDSLGPEGARALQPALSANRTNLQALALYICGIGNEGVSAIVNALQDNSTIKLLDLQNNSITSNGLPHLTRLLQQNESLEQINLCNNPGLFDDEQNTRLFSSALSRTTMLLVLNLSCCQMQGQAFLSLFRAVAVNKKLKTFAAYDHIQPQGQVLERLLQEIIPNMKNLVRLQVNLDFTDESVLSGFHRNTSLQHLHIDEVGNVQIATGPAFDILKRNRRLQQANTLLEHEPQSMIPWGDIWAKGIERLGDDNTGATAVYKILQDKLVMWWAPKTSTSTNTNAAAGVAVSSKSNDKRLHPQESTGEATTSMEEERKRSRHS